MEQPNAVCDDVTYATTMPSSAKTGNTPISAVRRDADTGLMVGVVSQVNAALLLLPCTVAGMKFTALLDTGASHNFISNSMIQLIRQHMQTTKQHVRLDITYTQPL